MAGLGQPYDPQRQARGDAVGYEAARRGSADDSRPASTFNSAGQWARGDINNVGGNQFNDNRQRHDYYDEPNPFTELASGQGVPRAVIGVGLLLSLTGFALWMSFIFSGFGSDPSSTEVGFPPIAILGFALFAIGGVIASIGTGLSLAARRRQSGW
jgi:hypothetical protein